MAKAPTSEPIRLENVRLSFPHIYKAHKFAEGQEPRFQATFLLDPAKEAHKALLAKVKAEIARLSKEAYGSEKLPPDVKACVGNGNNKTYDGYKDMVYISTSNTTRPVVVNRVKEPVAEGESQAPYAGCYVNATLTLWAQKNQWGKRINANLRAIQFVADGPAFGRPPVDADDEFEALPDDGSAPAGVNGITEDDLAF